MISAVVSQMRRAWAYECMSACVNIRVTIHVSEARFQSNSLSHWQGNHRSQPSNKNGNAKANENFIK